MDDYIFRRELDFSTNFPEMIVQLKQDCQFHKLEPLKQIELYDKCYALAKQIFLSGFSDAEKFNQENAATQHILEHARQEWEKTLISEGYYDG